MIKLQWMGGGLRIAAHPAGREQDISAKIILRTLANGRAGSPCRPELEGTTTPAASSAALNQSLPNVYDHSSFTHIIFPRSAHPRLHRRV
jgi:hypothetical protein